MTEKRYFKNGFENIKHYTSTESKPFKLDDFDSEVEMWELLNTQREVILDLEKKNEQLKLENGEMEDYLGRLEEENEQLKNEFTRSRSIRLLSNKN